MVLGGYYIQGSLEVEGLSFHLSLFLSGTIVPWPLMDPC